MNRNEWRICKFEYLGYSHWQVYRLVDTTISDEIGNRAFANGVFETEYEAWQYAKKLNGISE